MSRRKTPGRGQDMGIARRDFLRTIGVVGGVVGGVMAGAATIGRAAVARASGRGSDRRESAAPARAAGDRRRAPSAEVRAFFGPLRAGSRLGRYAIVAVYDVHLGAIPVVLRAPGGAAFQVDVLRRGSSPGVATTRSLALYLSNRGDRAAPTDERDGLGAMALAAALAHREAAGARPPALLTIEERSRRHPDGAFDVLV